MSYLGKWEIDDALTFTVTTHDATTGVSTDADSVPSYRVYEDETGTAILTGSMAKLDDANTTGFYSEAITLSSANGFEVGKSYSIIISATVDSNTGATNRSFQVQAAVATAAALATVDSNVDAILVDTGTTLPASLSTIDTNVDAILVDTAEIGVAGAGLTALATQVSVDTIDSNVDAILVDTGTTLPASLSTIDSNVDAILVDTGTTLPASLSTIDSNVDAILVDTGTTLDGKLNTIDTNVDAILVDTAEIGVAGAGLTALATQASVDTIDSNVDAILVDTAEIGAAGAGLTALATQASVDTIDTNVDAILVDTGTTLPGQISGLNDLSSADVNAACDTALSDYDAPTKAEMDAAFTEIKGASWSSGTDTLEAIRDRGDAAWLTGAGGSAPTVEAIRAEIDSNSTQLAAILTDTGTTIPAQLSNNETTVNTISTKMDEVHKIHGLDASNPMTVTSNSRTTGSITQSISGDGATTSTVTRT